MVPPRRVLLGSGCLLLPVQQVGSNSKQWLPLQSSTRKYANLTFELTELFFSWEMPLRASSWDCREGMGITGICCVSGDVSGQPTARGAGSSGESLGAP